MILEIIAIIVYILLLAGLVGGMIYVYFVYYKGLTPLQPPNGGLTPLQPPNGGLTPLQPPNGGLTPLQPPNGGLTPLQPPNGGLTPLQPPNGNGGLTPLQPPTQPPETSWQPYIHKPDGQWATQMFPALVPNSTNTDAEKQVIYKLIDYSCLKSKTNLDKATADCICGAACVYGKPSVNTNMCNCNKPHNPFAVNF